MLAYKLESTNDLLTSNAGLLSLGHLIEHIGLINRIDTLFPKPGSNRGYVASSFALPLIYNLHLGGDCLDDVLQLESDRCLCRLLGIKKIPKPCSIGDWLRRHGTVGLQACSILLRDSVKIGLGRCSTVTLDIDATFCRSSHQEAHYSYLGDKGYMPIVGTIAESSQMIAIDFRKGNCPPSAGNLDFIHHCQQMLPEGVSLKAVRIDAAGYQYKILDYLIEQQVEFAIRAKMSGSLKQAIQDIKPSSWHCDANNPHQELAKMVHSMHDSQHAFEVVVQRIAIQDQLSIEFDDDCETEEFSCGRYLYRAIATNSKRNNKDLIDWYNQRADDAENRIRDFKSDFGASKPPCKDFGASALYLTLCALAHNLFVLLKLVLPPKLHSGRIKKIRFKIYNIAGKLTRHARQFILKVPKQFVKMFNDIKDNLAQLPIIT